jgi:hypothetical protein
LVLLAAALGLGALVVRGRGGGDKEPTDAELRAYFAAHADRFRVDARFTFSQIYLDPKRRGAALDDEVKRLLVDLRARGADAEIETLGDPTALEPYFRLASAADVADSLGPEFAARLAELPAGQWQGPISSSRGVHLIFVHEREDGHGVAFDEVREAVRRDWEHARRTAATDALRH